MLRVLFPAGGLQAVVFLIMFLSIFQDDVLLNLKKIIIR